MGIWRFLGAKELKKTTPAEPSPTLLGLHFLQLTWMVQNYSSIIKIIFVTILGSNVLHMQT